MVSPDIYGWRTTLGQVRAVVWLCCLLTFALISAALRGYSYSKLSFLQAVAILLWLWRMAVAGCFAFRKDLFQLISVEGHPRRLVQLAAAALFTDAFLAVLLFIATLVAVSVCSMSVNGSALCTHNPATNVPAGVFFSFIAIFLQSVCTYFSYLELRRMSGHETPTNEAKWVQWKESTKARWISFKGFVSEKWNQCRQPSALRDTAAHEAQPLASPPAEVPMTVTNQPATRTEVDSEAAIMSEPEGSQPLRAASAEREAATTNTHPAATAVAAAAATTADTTPSPSTVITVEPRRSTANTSASAVMPRLSTSQQFSAPQQQSSVPIPAQAEDGIEGSPSKYEPPPTIAPTGNNTGLVHHEAGIAEEKKHEIEGTQSDEKRGPKPPADNPEMWMTVAVCVIRKWATARSGKVGKIQAWSTIETVGSQDGWLKLANDNGWIRQSDEKTVFCVRQASAQRWKALTLVNMRVFPSLTASRLAQVPAGETVTSYGTVGDWLRTPAGYCLLKLRGELLFQNVEESKRPATPQTLPMERVVTTERVKVHKFPDPDAEVIGMLNEAFIVAVDGKQPDTEWIRLSRGRGWIQSRSDNKYHVQNLGMTQRWKVIASNLEAHSDKSASTPVTHRYSKDDRLIVFASDDAWVRTAAGYVPVKTGAVVNLVKMKCRNLEEEKRIEQEKVDRQIQYEQSVKAKTAEIAALQILADMRREELEALQANGKSIVSNTWDQFRQMTAATVRSIGARVCMLLGVPFSMAASLDTGEFELQQAIEQGIQNSNVAQAMNDDARGIHTVYRLKVCDALVSGLKSWLKDSFDSIASESFNICSMWKFKIQQQSAASNPEDRILKEKFDVLQQLNASPATAAAVFKPN